MSVRPAAAVRLEACRALTDWGRLRAAITTAPMRRSSALEHEAIADAIAARDATAAQHGMRAHLQSVHLAFQSGGAGCDHSPEPRELADGHADTAKPMKRAASRRTSKP
jgi:hypothetical protein